jgi:membrane-bound ClpP family serine protease
MGTWRERCADVLDTATIFVVVVLIGIAALVDELLGGGKHDPCGW